MIRVDPKEISKHLRGDGLPHAPAAFVRKPFVDLGNGIVVASSPWMIREHMRGGIWSCFLRASAKLGKADDWLRAFGLNFEAHCVALASEAQDQPKFRGAVEVSKKPGTGEVEDVVIREPKGVVLFSAKARMMKESVARQAISRSDIVDWFEEFLFAKKGEKGQQRFRDGAVRLLDVNVRRALLGTPGKVYPVVLTYDYLGDSGVLYKWIDRRCRRLGLLQTPGVQCLSIMTGDEFETLLGLTAKGKSAVDLLEMKTSSEWRDARMSTFLHSQSRGRGHMRLPSVERHFKEVTKRVNVSLFGVSLEA